MKKLRIAYFGTPYFSARFLERMLTDTTINQLIEVKLVVTQPDQPIGRKQILTKSPVKVVAEKYGISVISNQLSVVGKNNFNEPNTDYRKLTTILKYVDMAFLFAYGGIIPKELLNLPKLGFWNTHPSLLPKYRGALPIAMPLILSDQETGVSLIKLDEKVDHGPIIAQEKLTIRPNDKKPDLEIKLTDLALEVFKKIIIPSMQRPLSRWYIKEHPQNHSKATFTYQLKKDDGFVPLSTLKKALNNEPIIFPELPKFIFKYIHKYNLVRNWLAPRRAKHGVGKLEFKNSAKIIYDYFRGLYPWPGIWTLINIREYPLKIRGNHAFQRQKRLKITNMTLVEGRLKILRIQLEGKKEVDFRTFNSAYSVF